MFMILLGAAVTVGWAVIGVVVLNQPVISHMSYACAWSVVLVLNAVMLIDLICTRIRKH